MKPITPISINLASGELTEDTKDKRVTPLLRWMARAVLDYARTGKLPNPSNGTVTIAESSICGSCGRPLTDDTSIELGIGPECERQLYGKTTPRSKAARSAGCGLLLICGDPCESDVRLRPPLNRPTVGVASAVESS